MNTIELFQNSAELLTESPTKLFNDHVVLQHLLPDSELTAILICERDHAPSNTIELLATLRKKFAKYFSKSEIKGILADLGVDYENYSDEKAELIREGLQHIVRIGQVKALIKICTRLRPKVDWPKSENIEAVNWIEKEHVGVVLNINNPALGKAASYLTEKNIDADLLFLSNMPTPQQIKYLTYERTWEKMAHEFTQVLKSLRDQRSSIAYHYFFAAPVGLTFLMGCALSKISPSYVYHHDYKSGEYNFVGNGSSHF